MASTPKPVRKIAKKYGRHNIESFKDTHPDLYKEHPGGMRKHIRKEVKENVKEEFMHGGKKKAFQKHVKKMK